PRSDPPSAVAARGRQNAATTSQPEVRRDAMWKGYTIVPVGSGSCGEETCAREDLRGSGGGTCGEEADGPSPVGLTPDLASRIVERGNVVPGLRLERGGAGARRAGRVRQVDARPAARHRRHGSRLRRDPPQRQEGR